MDRDNNNVIELIQEAIALREQFLSSVIDFVMTDIEKLYEEDNPDYASKQTSRFIEIHRLGGYSFRATDHQIEIREVDNSQYLVLRLSFERCMPFTINECSVGHFDASHDPEWRDKIASIIKNKKHYILEFKKEKEQKIQQQKTAGEKKLNKRLIEEKMRRLKIR